VEWLLVAVPVVALIALFGPGRYGFIEGRYLQSSPPDDDGPEGAAGVREPRRPPPSLDRSSATVDPYA
jgi:hypothetical protein